MLVLCCVLLISVIGCSGNQVRITPIQQTDFFPVKAGETFTAPKQGWFASDEVVEEVWQAKID